MASFTPEPYHCAGPKHFVNGGVLATLIDCHCVCTAAAAAYRDAGREIGQGSPLHFATASLSLDYARPTPLGPELQLLASIAERTDRTYVLSCELIADGKVRATGVVTAIQVPDSWVEAPRLEPA